MVPAPYRDLLAELSVVQAAQSLLGATLRTEIGTAIIVETEAYGSTEDLGSHAARGRTARNQVMFGPPGLAYVYFTYGMHWLLNVTCRPEDEPGAVLLRAAQPVTGLERIRQRRPKAKSDLDLLSGPAKITQGLAVEAVHNGIDLLSPNSSIFIEPNPAPVEFISSTRIGLGEGKGEHLPWRFIDATRLEWASKPHPKPS
jgi:DNA-3-methyladenine glycosylase